MSVNKYLSKETISIFTIWLFIVSGLIGIGIGYEDWFIPKTPLNLIIGFILLILNTTFDSWKVILGFAIAFAVGMVVEILGVSTGQIFGEYTYGRNLGPKLLKVPYIIGIYWAVLVIVTSTIGKSLFKHWLPIAVIGSGLMVFLDLHIEKMAPRFDFWKFAESPVPIENYIAWFIISFGLQVCIYFLVKQTSVKYAWHMYLSQSVFFVISILILD